MSLFGFFGGDSKSSTSTSTTTYDQKLGADNGGVANRVDAKGDVIIGSDAVANHALNSAQNFLTSSTDFLDKELTNLLTVINNNNTAVTQNAKSAQDIAAGAIAQAQSTDVDKFIKLISAVLVAGVAIVAFKSKAVKL
jgi:hypothetical protein